jgi:hypothetical protein
MHREETDTLELSAFIKETLVEIIQGVERARTALEDIDTGAEICPTGLHFKGESPAPFKAGRGFVQEVEFDVAITVSKGESAGGTGGGHLSIGVPSLEWLGGAGIEGQLRREHQRERSEVSHVRFTVPVLLPSDVHPWTEENGEEKPRSRTMLRSKSEQDC